MNPLESKFARLLGVTGRANISAALWVMGLRIHCKACNGIGEAPGNIGNRCYECGGKGLTAVPLNAATYGTAKLLIEMQKGKPPKGTK